MSMGRVIGIAQRATGTVNTLTRAAEAATIRGASGLLRESLADMGLSARGDRATGVMTMPRQPLSLLRSLSTTRDAHGGAENGLVASMQKELRGVLSDAAAWRAAWSELQHGGQEHWASALAPLEHLESRAAQQLRSWSPDDAPSPSLNAQTRDKLVDLQDLLWGMRDGQMLLAWASMRGPATPMQLAEHFGLDANAAATSKVQVGAHPLSQQESMALSIYSVSPAVQMLRQPELSRLFHGVNAALRHDQPEMKWALQGVTQPLLSGMERLPVVNEAPVVRGLWLAGPDAYAAVRDRMQTGAQFNTADILTGSREAPYPGQVVFVMQPMADARHTRARDTAAFSHADEQREAAFLPGARFEVQAAQQFDPGKKGAAGLTLSDAVAESSGRSWQALKEQPLLVVSLRELPASPKPD